MEKKAPPCQILKAAPWQKKRRRRGPGDTHPFGSSLEETTIVREMDPEEIRGLFWDKDKAKTPTKEDSKKLAHLLKALQEEE